MHQKQLIQIFNHPFVVVVITLLSLFSLISLHQRNRSAIQSQQSIEQLEEHLKVLEQNYSDYQAQINKQQTPLTIEKIMRNELLKQKSDEIILQIPTANQDSTNLDLLSSTVNTGPLEEWRKLFNF